LASASYCLSCTHKITRHLHCTVNYLSFFGICFILLVLYTLHTQQNKTHVCKMEYMSLVYMRVVLCPHTAEQDRHAADFWDAGQKRMCCCVLGCWTGQKRRAAAFWDAGQKINKRAAALWNAGQNKKTCCCFLGCWTKKNVLLHFGMLVKTKRRAAAFWDAGQKINKRAAALWNAGQNKKTCCCFLGCWTKKNVLLHFGMLDKTKRRAAAFWDAGQKINKTCCCTLGCWTNKKTCCCILRFWAKQFGVRVYDLTSGVCALPLAEQDRRAAALWDAGQNNLERVCVFDTWFLCSTFRRTRPMYCCILGCMVSVPNATAKPTTMYCCNLGCMVRAQCYSKTKTNVLLQFGMHGKCAQCYSKSYGR